MINEVNPRCVKLLSEKGYIIFENNEDICFHIFRTFFYLSNVPTLCYSANFGTLWRSNKKIEYVITYSESDYLS
jgi:hypothetical protein